MLRRIFLILTASVLTAGGRPVTAVDSIGMTVSNLDRSLEFYLQVLGFEKVSDFETHGDAIEHATGVFGARIRTARLRLGAEFLELTEYLTPHGRAFPDDSRGNDLWFQHIAIVTGDMDRAYRHLRAHNVRHASPAPQSLPAWNPTAAGIQAFYFRDPDGHFLEIISFPDGKGEARWHGKSEPLFLGIDHTAIVISDMEASTKFYSEALGMHVAGDSENHGPEQERLNNVFGARLRIRGMRADSGPGVEFLQYLAPSGGRPFPAGSMPNDLVHWHTRFRTGEAASTAERLRDQKAAFVSSGVVEMPDARAGFRKSVLVRDPDGHAVMVAEEVMFEPHRRK
ncbi:MAG: VOC family protein [Bryobacteraceae bacterium]